MALGALRAFADAGRRIPEDVAVVGFDDVVDAAQYRPPLTTIRQDFDALGARAVATLLAMIEEGEAPSHETVAGELVVRVSSRASCAVRQRLTLLRGGIIDAPARPRGTLSPAVR